MPLPTLLTCEHRPLSMDEEVFFNDFALAEATDPRIYNPAKSGRFSGREYLLINQLQTQNLPASTGLIKFVSFLCGNNMQNVLLWAFTLNHLRVDSPNPYLDLYTYLNAFTDMTVPTELGYRQTWEALKSPSGGPHLLDQPSNWQV